MRIQSIFLHFFDIHFLQQKGIKYANKAVIQECNLATRLAILYSEKIIVPAASYFESSLCSSIINSYRELFPLGIIEFSGNANHLEHFREKKIKEYSNQNDLLAIYQNLKNRIDFFPPFTKRTRSATNDISDYWIKSFNDGNIIRNLEKIHQLKIPKDFDKKWMNLPEYLGNKAFIVSNVQPILGNISKNPEVIDFLHTTINQGYFSSYTKDFQSGIITDLVYLNSGFTIDSYNAGLPYRKLILNFKKNKVFEKFINLPTEELIFVKNEYIWQNILYNALVQEPQSWIDSIQKRFFKGGYTNIMRKIQTFIVHGHNRELLFELKDFIQNDLSLPEPIILEQQPKKGKTIIESIEENVYKVDVVFCFLTPDDEAIAGKTKTAKLARQNVIFELGFFMGKFGRKSGRIIILYKSPLLIPSDLTGILYIDVSNGIKSASNEIRKELESI
jgi:predicted nucleotide-binding protein